MADTVHLPLVGDVKKTWAYVGGAAVVGIAGLAWWRNRQAGTASAGLSTDPNAIDPATGLTYAEEASQSGGYMYGSVGSGGGSAVTDQFGSALPAPIFTGTQNAGITSNQDWLSAGEATNLGGTTQDAIAAALTKVLGGIPVTQSQADIFNEIVGIIGQPPQGHPPMHMVTTQGPGVTPVSSRKPLAWHIMVTTVEGQTIREIQTAAYRFANLTAPVPLATYINEAGLKTGVSPNKPLHKGTKVWVNSPAGFTV